MGDRPTDSSFRPLDSSMVTQPGQVPHHAGNEQNRQTFNMAAVASALPDYSMTMPPNQAQMPHHQQSRQPPPTQQSSQRGVSGASTSAVVYQLQQNMQYPGQLANSYPVSPHGPSGYAQQAAFANQPLPPSQLSHPAAYQTFNTPQAQMGQSNVQQPYQTFQQHPAYYYYPSPYGLAGQPTQMFSPNTSHHTTPSRRSSFPMSQVPFGYHGSDLISPTSGYPHGTKHFVTNVGMADPSGMGAQTGFLSTQELRKQASEGSLGSVPRGPPRKPRQSGHALWVGNLPPGTTVIDLKDHFSQDATRDIESLFLISKSNCAFVNYRTESSCNAAMHRFHDSRFHGVRLVCRLRRGSAPTSGVPTGPSAMSAPRDIVASPQRSPVTAPLEKSGEEEAEEDNVDDAIENTAVKDKDEDEETNVPTTNKATDRFFIVKSLTLQDLELSVRNGIWATQSHNEQRLNQAYETAQNVFLIFSANKSGEYFGYAKMVSSISEATPPTTTTTAAQGPPTTSDAPKSIPTPATTHAPKGRIIDDSARGTIFWEAELSDGEEEPEKAVDESGETLNEGITAENWGKQFKVEWMSTNKLPFFRTRGLRNPWNANREVKIARDGTELETSVGKRLLQMFHRAASSVAGAPKGPQQMTLPVPHGGPHMGGPSIRSPFP